MENNFESAEDYIVEHTPEQRKEKIARMISQMKDPQYQKDALDAEDVLVRMHLAEYQALVAALEAMEITKTTIAWQMTKIKEKVIRLSSNSEVLAALFLRNTPH